MSVSPIHRAPFAAASFAVRFGRTGAVVDFFTRFVARFSGRWFSECPTEKDDDSDGILVFDAEGRTVGVNAAALRILGWTPSPDGVSRDAFLARFPALRRIAPETAQFRAEFVVRTGALLRKLRADRMSLRHPDGETWAELYTIHVLKTHSADLQNGCSRSKGKIPPRVRDDGPRTFQTICCSCKRVCDRGGKWQDVEKYIQSFLNVTFSHGICPECLLELYGETSAAPSSAGIRLRRLESGSADKPESTLVSASVCGSREA